MPSWETRDDGRGKKGLRDPEVVKCRDGHSFLPTLGVERLLKFLKH